MSSIKYRGHDSVTHLIGLLRYPLFPFQEQLLLFFVVCILLHLHLVSFGLCSWMYLVTFPYANEVHVDTNAELVVLCLTLVFVVWHRVWHRLNPCTILPLSRCSTFFCFSLHLSLRTHLPPLFSSPLCYASYCAFLEGIANTLFFHLFHAASLHLFI